MDKKAKAEHTPEQRAAKGESNPTLALGIRLCRGFGLAFLLRLNIRQPLSLGFLCFALGVRL